MKNFLNTEHIKLRWKAVCLVVQLKKKPWLQTRLTNVLTPMHSNSICAELAPVDNIDGMHKAVY